MIWKEGGDTKIRQCPKDPKFGLLVNWTKGGVPATLSKCEVSTHMHCMQKADASEIVKTGDIVRAAYDLDYGKDVVWSWSGAWEPSRTSPPFHPSPPSRGIHPSPPSCGI